MATAFNFDAIDWEHIAETADYSPARLNMNLGISRRQLERILKVKFGRSPRRWMDGLRLNIATKRLLDGQFVKSVAFDLGFKHTSHFSLWFKRHTGYGPRAFYAHECLKKSQEMRCSL